CSWVSDRNLRFWLRLTGDRGSWPILRDNPTRFMHRIMLQIAPSSYAQRYERSGGDCISGNMATPLDGTLGERTRFDFRNALSYRSSRQGPLNARRQQGGSRGDGDIYALFKRRGGLGEFRIRARRPAHTWRLRFLM